MNTPILGVDATASVIPEPVSCPPDHSNTESPERPITARKLNDWAADQLGAYLHGIRQASLFIHDLAGLSEFTVDLTLQELASRRSSLMLLDNQQILRILAARGVPDWVQQRTALRLGEGVAGRVASAGRPMFVSNGRSAPAAADQSGKYRTESFISVPVPGERKILGVVNVTDPVDESPFECHDLEQLVNIADSVGGTIEQALRYRELQELAIRDELTGLYNRRHLLNFLDTILERARTENFPVTVLLFDIDHFKQFNDQFGHPAGDQVLRELAQLMRDNFRTHDLVSRLGGEEFAVVLWDGRGEPTGGAWHTYPTTAFEFAERLRQSTSRHRFNSINHAGVTLSGGLATFPWDGATSAELIQQADTALYRAKRDGRNRVYFCGASRSA